MHGVFLSCVKFSSEVGITKTLFSAKATFTDMNAWSNLSSRRPSWRTSWRGQVQLRLTCESSKKACWTRRVCRPVGRRVTPAGGKSKDRSTARRCEPLDSLELFRRGVIENAERRIRCRLSWQLPNKVGIECEMDGDVWCRAVLSTHCFGDQGTICWIAHDADSGCVQYSGSGASCSTALYAIQQKIQIWSSDVQLNGRLCEGVFRFLHWVLWVRLIKSWKDLILHRKMISLVRTSRVWTKILRSIDRMRQSWKRHVRNSMVVWMSLFQTQPRTVIYSSQVWPQSARMRRMETFITPSSLPLASSES